MERDSLLYKLRRKGQAMAYYLLPHAVLSKLYFRICLHETMDLKNPKKFNEKMQWLKLNYYPKDPLAVQGADKYAVREYVEKKGYGDKLIKLLGTWERAQDIPWDTLPQKFMLKCNHGCAYNIACTDKDSLDKKSTQKQLNAWLRENFAAFNVELHYEKIKPRRIICEEYLGDVLTDYKFFCFHGEPKFFYVSSDLTHDRQAKIGFFHMDGSVMPVIRDDYEHIGNIPMPDCLPDMVAAAKVLSEDFPFVRVDFFQIGDTFKFSELTFTPGACMMPLKPKEYDVQWGKMLDLSALQKRF